MGARLANARWWGGSYARRPPYVSPPAPPIDWVPLGVDLLCQFDAMKAFIVRSAFRRGFMSPFHRRKKAAPR